MAKRKSKTWKNGITLETAVKVSKQHDRFIIRDKKMHRNPDGMREGQEKFSDFYNNFSEEERTQIARTLLKDKEFLKHAEEDIEKGTKKLYQLIAKNSEVQKYFRNFLEENNYRKTIN